MAGPPTTTPPTSSLPFHLVSAVSRERDCLSSTSKSHLLRPSNLPSNPRSTYRPTHQGRNPEVFGWCENLSYLSTTHRLSVCIYAHAPTYHLCILVFCSRPWSTILVILNILLTEASHPIFIIRGQPPRKWPNGGGTFEQISKSFSTWEKKDFFAHDFFSTWE